MDDQRPKRKAPQLRSAQQPLLSVARTPSNENEAQPVKKAEAFTLRFGGMDDQRPTRAPQVCSPQQPLLSIKPTAASEDAHDQPTKAPLKIAVAKSVLTKASLSSAKVTATRQPLQQANKISAAK